MKITSIDIFEVASEMKSASNKWRPIVVKINTDEGICGFGEVGLSYGHGAAAGFGMAKDLASLLIGMNPMNNEKIWDKLLRKTFWGQGGGGVVFAGMSGLDAALWDIKGKALGVPVYQLLGGKVNNELRTYASQLQFNWGKNEEKRNLVEPEEYAQATLRAIEEGFDAIKVDVLGVDHEGKWLSRDLTGILGRDKIKMGYDRLAAMREAGGDNLDIIVEQHSFTDTTGAIQFGKAIEDIGVFYYEEPTMPLNSDLMREIKNKVNIPLAAGERIYSRWGFRPFLENRSLDVIQPDFGNCGGITEGKKICDMANVYDVTVQGHVCGGPIATAMALHVEAAIPNFLIHELHRYATVEDNINSCKYDYQPIDGAYKVPEIPGLGQELTQEKMDESICVTVK